ncbi:septin and tuftelin-interacting protein 1 homolog 1 [Andrographis paniculata]|uniref:septin and tuftelin-interacting protein 1 homolog 1 n=1 Tax=Andrographis paniculata TaxID=175694 RepID=UPI0021E8D466|nr:septin and tuftelin-interacting protein 1 homolog 1 [Andrographis paniculata]XP_051134355.1 septin and tuftelin-interacting protein 1 homolog 1 [Andrographis paniculata]
MNDYQEMERFDMDNDYEYGEWIGGEFYGKLRQKRAPQTKDDVLYGVFAEGDSDSDSYGGLGSKKKRRKDAGKKIIDYTKPVSFISTGSVLPNREIDHKSNEDEAEDEDTSKPAGLGVGASAGIGYGATSSNAGIESKSLPDEDESFLPSAFGKKIEEGARLRREREKEKSIQAKKKPFQAAAERDSNQNGVGEFEKHTKGIGMKLLEKMGYKGGGLGKNQQGIMAPIEAKMRPKNMGMGFKDFKEVTVVPPLQESVEKSLPLPSYAVSSRSKEKLWSKKASKKKAYVTAEELLAQKQEQGFEVVQKVFDMRGPQPRILVNLENLNAEEKAREQDVPMPELQHNIKLTVDVAELDIQKLDKELRNEREKVVALQDEMKKLQNVANEQKLQLENMREVMNVLDQIAQKDSSGTLTLDYLAASFGDLQTRFYDTYTLRNLSCIACSYALPLFIRIFQGWDPLQNPTHGMESISQWKKLLQEKESFSFSDAVSPYVQLLMEVVLPAVRISGTNSWEARDSEPMIRFLEDWKDLLPSPVLQTILTNIVMPKITAAVDSWDPRRERIPIHHWIHPWLPLLGNKLEHCYHTIRTRLASVLHAWQPNDMSAHYMLSPWMKVFDAASWELLMVRYIIPKLLGVMRELQINPANQNLDQFNWVMAWANAIPTHHMLQLMDVFFDKWQEVLYHWLCSKPNFEEVTNWYLGWKELLPQELQANEHVRYRLNVGLDMMNQAVEGLEVAPPGLKENISYLKAHEQRQFENQKKAAAQAQQRASPGIDNGIQAEKLGSAAEMSLKEVIEIHAQHNGLLFRPKPGRTHDGHQIYGFGNISIIIDSLNQKVLAQTEDRWTLVSLEQLLELHNLSRMKR